MSAIDRVARRVLLLATTALVAGGAQARGQEGSRVGFTPAEKDFIVSTAMAVNYEIAAARVAGTRGSSDVVKRFAAATLADHSALLERLRGVAAADPSVVMPTALNTVGEERMRALEGAADGFDMTYRGQMLSSHTELQLALKAFLESTTTNPRLRAVIASAQPVEDAHLNAAKELPRRT